MLIERGTQIVILSGTNVPGSDATFCRYVKMLSDTTAITIDEQMGTTMADGRIKLDGDMKFRLLTAASGQCYNEGGMSMPETRTIPSGTEGVLQSGSTVSLLLSANRPSNLVPLIAGIGFLALVAAVVVWSD